MRHRYGLSVTLALVVALAACAPTQQGEEADATQSVAPMTIETSPPASLPPSPADAMPAESPDGSPAPDPASEYDY